MTSLLQTRTLDSATSATKLHPFLVDDREALRLKIAGLSGIWSKRWGRFLEQAAAEKRHVYWYGGDTPDTPMHATFAYVATGDEKWAAIGARDMRWLRDHYEETLDVGNQEHDTWIYAAVMLRRAVALDWLWDSGALSAEELDGLADLFITDSFKYPYVTLHNRVPPHANNQGMAMALNLVTVGWLFGHRRGDDARARHLFKVGIPHLLQQIAYLPPGGYSGEGSTYIIGVADPLTALACAVLEAVSGEDYLHREFWPNGNSIAKILELNARLAPPSEVYPAWDQHGFMLHRSGTTAAYLAHRTGEPSKAHSLLHGQGWELSSSFAWMQDDHVWQLLWMPDPTRLCDLGKVTREVLWAEQRVAGAIEDEAGQHRLFQMWDVADSRPVRRHMNPNSILLESWGSLLTVDGNSLPGRFALDADPRMQFLHQYSATPKVMSWAAGSLGAHSCIVVDGAIDLVPEPMGDYQNLPSNVTTGWLRRMEARPGLKCISADVSDFYKKRFGMSTCTRTSCWVDERFWVIVDEIRAESPHDFCWQLVLRDGAELTEYGARLRTAEQVVLDILNVDGCEAALHSIEGYPSTLEQRCHHLRKACAGQHQLEFVTVLIPRLARTQLNDWTNEWRVRPDPENKGLAEKWQQNGTACEPTLWTSGELSDAYYLRNSHYNPDCKEPREDTSTVWFQKEIALPTEVGSRRFWLELPRATKIDLWIDMEPVEMPPLFGYHQYEPRLQAPFVDVTPYMQSGGTSTLTLRISQQSKFGIVGGVRLHAGIEPEPPIWRREGDRVIVEFDGKESGVRLSDLRSVDRTPAERNVEPIGETVEHVTAEFLALTDLQLQWSQQGTGFNSGDPISSRLHWCAAAMEQPLAQVEDRLIALVHDPAWVVQMMAVIALAHLGSKKAVPSIVECLENCPPLAMRTDTDRDRFRVKEMCLVALGRLGDSSAADAVARCLNAHEFYGVRRIAADILGALGNESHMDVLNAWKHDADGETANASLRSIEKINRSCFLANPKQT